MKKQNGVLEEFTFNFQFDGNRNVKFCIQTDHKHL